MPRKFREKNEHAPCDVCGKLKRRIATAMSKQNREEAYRAYSRHILSQWLDRQTYWKLRSLSQDLWRVTRPWSALPLEMSCLTTIADGMDQSKLKVPRLGYAKRFSKSMEQLFRPRCHLAAAWFPGYKLFLFLSDEDLKKIQKRRCNY